MEQPSSPGASDDPRGSGRAGGGGRAARSAAIRLIGAVPLVGWLRRSDRASRRSDALAGLTVAAMLVPQAMAYAALAGMPPVTGLYAATVPLVAYALLGSSGQLAFGPVAIVSLLTASTLAPLADGDPARYVTLAGLLALLVGAIQVTLGLLRAGRLTALLSHSVISGFTSAAAIVIATSQLDDLLGLSIGSPSSWLERTRDLVVGLDATHLPTLAVGVVAVALLIAGKRLASRIPTALVVVVLATAAVPLLGLDGLGVGVIGEVPRGLPAPSLPTAPLDAVLTLLPGALIIALLAYLEGISVARAVAARTRDRIAPDRELLASGAANLAAGMFAAFPVAGGFSRTAVNHDAGAHTPLATLVTAGGVLLALVALAPLFTTLPRAVLAAIVVTAVVSLIDLRGARRAWHVDRSDGAALTITFAATLLLGVELGIALGIAASLLISLWRVGQVRVDAATRPHEHTLFVEGPLLPASAAQLQRAIEDHVARGDPDLRVLTIDLGGCPSTDLSGAHALGDAYATCRAADLEARITGARPAVAGRRRTGRRDVRTMSGVPAGDRPTHRHPKPDTRHPEAAAVHVHTLETPSLGDRSYVVADAAGTAIVIDPQRDIDRVLAVVAEHGLSVSHVFETHNHNDYVTGGVELVRVTDATYVMSADEEMFVPFHGVHDGDEMTVGELTITALHTPGHTPTHMSYVVTDGGQRAVFTGGSMLYGSVGRTDLISRAATEELTRAQFHTARRLADELPDHTTVLPTHGFGSFCSSATADEQTASVDPKYGVETSTIGDQRRANVALTIAEEQEFVDRLIAGLDAYPRYYAHMAARNRVGPGPVDLSPATEADPTELQHRIHAGEWVVDLRSRTAYASDHVTGTINVEGGDSFLTYLAWIIPWGQPVTLVGDTQDEVDDAQRQLVRVGIDRPAAQAVGGVATYGAGLDRGAYPVRDLDALARRLTDGDDGVHVLDVRRVGERTEGGIVGSLHVPLHDLERRMDEVPTDGEIWVHCASGYRASIAASLLARAGRSPVLVDDLSSRLAEVGLELTTDG